MGVWVDSVCVSVCARTHAFVAEYRNPRHVMLFLPSSDKIVLPHTSLFKVKGTDTGLCKLV